MKPNFPVPFPLPIAALITRTSNTLRNDFTTLLDIINAGITPEEAMTMSTIRDFDGQNVGRIAEFMQKDRTTITRFLNSLQKKSLIERNPNPDDGRSILVTLSTQGEDLFDRIDPYIKSWIITQQMSLSPTEAATVTKILASTVQISNDFIANLRATYKST